MIIKEADDRAHDIKTLEALLTHPDADVVICKKITQQIKKIRVGLKGEKEAAYHINLHIRDSENWATIHDFRFQHADGFTQIDHLMINRCMEILVCESKYWANGIAINEHGEFISFYGKKAIGIKSPLEQVRRQRIFLQNMIMDKTIEVPRRFGISIKPNFHNAVLVSTNARITRPENQIEGIDSIIKADQISSFINKKAENGSSVLTVLKTISRQSLEDFANHVASFHKSQETDWHRKFGLTKSIPEMEEPLDDGHITKHKCESCNALLPIKVARYCWFNKDKFHNKLYCRACQ